jgi:hypothetical protein
LQSPGAMTNPNDTTETDAAPDPGASYVRRLLHRWLIEYNPLYLLSAALVLTGTFLCSRGLARDDRVYGPLGVALIAELYAACLIGGAALLMRIGHRRPAVMLALLTILYQWDLTLHTERTPYFGAWAAAAWVVVFAAKLYGLAWAMKLRLSRGASAAAILAGIGLAFFPLYMNRLEPREAGSLVAAWAFALASLHRSSAVTSLAPLEGWGATVLRRAVAAAWILSALLVSGHVLFWSSQGEIFLPALLPVVPLICVRGVRSEARVWALVLGTLLIVAAAMPAAFSVTALLAAAALCLRALSPSFPGERRPAQAGARPEPPYRAAVSSDPPEEPEIAVSFVPVRVDHDAMKRLLAGTVFALYLSVWTLGWSGGAWPAHVVALDVALTVVMVAAAWRARARIAIVPLLGSYVHLVVQAGLVPVPRTLVEWGASAVGLGFALLLASLVTSYRLRTTAG